MSFKAFAILPSTVVVMASAYSAIKGLLAPAEECKIDFAFQQQQSISCDDSVMVEAFEVKYLSDNSHVLKTKYSTSTTL